MQDWSHELFGALREAGGTAYSNYAVGYNNVHVPAATENRIAVGNTPGAHSPVFLVSDIVHIDLLSLLQHCCEFLRSIEQIDLLFTATSVKTADDMPGM